MTVGSGRVETWEGTCLAASQCCRAARICGLFHSASASRSLRLATAPGRGGSCARATEDMDTSSKLDETNRTMNFISRPFTIRVKKRRMHRGLRRITDTAHANTQMHASRADLDSFRLERCRETTEEEVVRGPQALPKNTLFAGKRPSKSRPVPLRESPVGRVRTSSAGASIPGAASGSTKRSAARQVLSHLFPCPCDRRFLS